MRKSSDDRRSQRTRLLLSQALVALMSEKRYDAITVQDIIDRANVGRSTFYSHYLDKEDLLVSNMTEVLDTLRQQMEQYQPGAPGTPPSLAPLFAHVQQHYGLYKALVRGQGIDVLHKKGHERLRRTIERYLQQIGADSRPSTAPVALVADYIAGAVLTLLLWWLEHEMPYPPAQMDRWFHQLVLPGVQLTLGLRLGLERDAGG